MGAMMGLAALALWAALVFPAAGEVNVAAVLVTGSAVAWTEVPCRETLE